MAEVPELGKSAANERAAKEEEIQVLDANYAFLVVKNSEGLHMVSLDVNVPLEVERQATLSEVKGALHAVLDDLNNQETAALSAQNIIMHQMQMARQVADARANQQLLDKLPTNLAG